MRTFALIWLLGAAVAVEQSAAAVEQSAAAVEQSAAVEESASAALITTTDVSDRADRRRLVGEVWLQPSEVIAFDGAAFDRFGHSVAVSGGILAVGSVGDDALRGSVYVYDVGDISSPSVIKKLTASDGEAGDQFGWSVAISGDVLAVGARGYYLSTGLVYVFDLSGDSSSWSSTETKHTGRDTGGSDFFGQSVALADGVLAVGAYGDDMRKGAVYVFERSDSSSSWPSETTNKLTASDGAERDYFGSSVAVADGIVAVGAPEDDGKSGSVYIFDLSEELTSWPYTETKKLTASDGAENDQFGQSVALSGNLLAVGAYGDDGNKGAIYVYDVSAVSSPSFKKKLTASDGATNDYFGRSVALFGGLLVVGAEFDDDNRGSVYVFDLSGAPASWPSSQTKFTASDGATNDVFGNTVALADGVLAVGAKNLGDGISSVYVGALGCEEGYFSKIKCGACESCPDGKISGRGEEACRDCDAGKTSNSGAYANSNAPHTECVSCNAGTFSNGDGICKLCDPGEFSAAGAGSCSPCGPGTYSDSEGQADECKQCGDDGTNGNWDPDQEGLTSDDECKCEDSWTGTNCDRKECKATTPTVSLGFLVLEVQWPRHVRTLSRNEAFSGISGAFRSFDLNSDNRLNEEEARSAIRAGGMAVPLKVSKIWSRDGITITEMVQEELARLEEQKSEEYYSLPSGSGEITEMEATYPNNHDGDKWNNDICPRRPPRRPTR